MCIQQTALDLLARNYEVHIVADGVSSRSMTDRMFALEVYSMEGRGEYLFVCWGEVGWMDKTRGVAKPL